MNVPTAESQFKLQQQEIYERTDNLFLKLFYLQWAAGILIALFVSPHTWIGASKSLHLNLYAAGILGSLISFFPVYLVHVWPGRTVTRHVVAAAQMLTSALLIHLSGGRIETHFHVFGSLAFLAFYRDWRVLGTATVVIGIDHLVRGLLYPESVFGVFSASPYRALEHAAWVIFENTFLCIAIRQSTQEMRRMAQQTVDLEQTVFDLGAATSHQQVFIASMSHELRTPLTAIIGYSELLSEAPEIQESDTMRSDVDRVNRSGKHLLELVDSILDISKIDSGRAEFNFDCCCPHRLVHDIGQVTRPMVTRNGNDFQVQVQDDLESFITDRDKLKQVLVQLLSNAGKFCENGTVTLEVVKDPSDDTLAFKVRDTGIGMSEQQMDVIFDRFVKIDDSVSRKFDGVGIGLYIAREFSRALGGSMAVESQLNLGTEFTIKVPRAGSPFLPDDEGASCPIG